MIYAIISFAIIVVAVAIIAPIIAVKRYKHKLAVKAQKEQELRDAQRVTDEPDISALTVVTLDANDPILQNFPYINSLVNLKYIEVTDVRIFLGKGGLPIYATVSISDTAYLSEHRCRGFTDVLFHDNGETTHLTTENMFKR